jgi:hypothetical protein
MSFGFLRLFFDTNSKIAVLLYENTAFLRGRRLMLVLFFPFLSSFDRVSAFLNSYSV